jgi:uncharacterized repeat protein (TIGR01451 family)
VTPPTVIELESGTFALPALAPGQTYAIVVAANVTAVGGTVTNGAAVAAPNGVMDTVPANDSASDTDSVLPAPPAPVDLSVTNDNGVASLTAGTSTTYTLTVQNVGAAAVTGALLADPAVDGLSKVSVTCGPGCATPPTIVELESGTFALPALASGASYGLIVGNTVTAAAGDTVVSTASVGAPAGTVDIAPSNNSSTDTDPVIAPVLLADLAMTVTANPGTVSSGGGITYTLTVVNNGPSGVADAVVTDVAPLGIVFGNWTCGVANAGSGGGVTTACGAPSGSGNVNTAVTLQPGATVTYVIAATVSAGASGSIADSARVDVPGGTTDSVPLNNASTAAINVEAAPPPPTQVAQPIPTLSEWALVALSLLMLAAALSMRRSARR